MPSAASRAVHARRRAEQRFPAWAPEFYAADDAARGALAATLRAYAGVDMNVLKAAQSLGVHPNTVYARLQRIFDISGLQARSFDALSDLLIVCDCRTYYPQV
jgi:sugar diacid utilization regulator